MNMKIFYIKIKRKIYKRFLPILKRIFFVFPVKKNKILFDNFGGKGFGDNPKYIAECLIKRNSRNFEIVWLIDNLMPLKEKQSFPKEIRLVNIDSIKGLYERATAKIWVDNIRNNHVIKKKREQFYLQAWHGPFGPKYVEKDAEMKLPKEYIKAAKYDGRIADSIIVDSMLQEIQFKNAFWLSDQCELLRIGLPRNDYLVNSSGNKKLKENVRKKIKLKSDIYYILYAPTFRDDFSLEGYITNFDEIINAYEHITKKQCAVIVRLHPNVRFQENFINFNNKIINGTLYPDIQELAIASDCVISDYSSSIFDFALINKPAFICALDIDHYKSTRGLMDVFYEFPFSIAYTEQQLVENILNFDKDSYNTKVNAYLKKYPIYDKGDASEKVVDWIVNRCR